MNRQLLPRAIGLGFVSLALMGFEPGTAHYKPPHTNVSPPPLSRTVDQPFEAVWNTLIQKAADSGYVLTGKDEETATLMFSFGALEPWQFVTGGHYRQSDPTPYHESQTRYGPVVTWRGDYVKFATEKRGGRLEASAKVKVTSVESRKTKVAVGATYEYLMGDVRWSFQTGDCVKMLVPDARPDTPLERTLCPTHRAEEQLLKLATGD
jgi:hypothetical protein